MGLTNVASDLLPGTLELLILRTLVSGAKHGYGIVEHLRVASYDALRVGESALYPTLQRLLINGWVNAVWGTSENNRRARYYTLTARGRIQLAAERAEFDRMVGRSGEGVAERVRTPMHGCGIAQNPQRLLHHVLQVEEGFKATSSLTLSMAIAMIFEASPLTGQTLHVEVLNQSRMPEYLVAQAKTIVTQIYELAEVKVKWKKSRGDLKIFLQQSADVTAARTIGSALGFAPGAQSGRGRIVYIFADRLNRESAGDTLLKTTVLAVTMAHEMGHLLLPFPSHSETGIMKSSFFKRDYQHATQGRLGFTDEQAQLLRCRVRSNFGSTPEERRAVDCSQ
jgi:transcriptional regulator